MVLVTASTAEKPKPGAGFFPLTVDYREYTYAAGRFPGGFIKREGRPSEREILTSRLIDRPIRPLFPEGYLTETQIIGMVLSADPDYDPAPLAIIGAAAALAISEIPFPYVLGGVRIGMVERRHTLPTPAMKRAQWSISTSSSQALKRHRDGRGRRQRVSEEDIVRCIEYGHECCRKIIAGIRELMSGRENKVRVQAAHQSTRMFYRRSPRRSALISRDAMNTEKYAQDRKLSRDR